MRINELVKDIHEWAISKGWHEEDLTPEQISEKLMLIVTEVAEAMEEHRKPEVRQHGYSYVYKRIDKKPEGFGIELADVVIRALQLAGALGIDMEKMLALKIEYNITRPHRHGGKAC